MAIVFALQTNAVVIYVNDEFNSSFNIPEKLTWAAICIIIAALVDFLDGFVARLLHATSSIGKQLDSLSDVVSFGVAPAVIIYQLLQVFFCKRRKWTGCFHMAFGACFYFELCRCIQAWQI